jgi:cytidylate kinase
VNGCQAQSERAVPVVTVDGPAASGKGTLAAGLAQALGFHLLDSGVFYRMLGWKALQSGVGLERVVALVNLAAELTPQFRGEEIWLDGENISLSLRRQEVGTAASKVAVLPEVRLALLRLQRLARRLPGLVADGRDMGTVVFPDATCKFFLTASVETRAERRHKQLIEKGLSSTISLLLQEISERDARDESREAAPLKPAADALIIDTTLIAAADVLALALRHCRQCLA